MIALDSIVLHVFLDFLGPLCAQISRNLDHQGLLGTQKPWGIKASYVLVLRRPDVFPADSELLADLILVFLHLLPYTLFIVQNTLDIG
jgi:hypothetical protein